MEVAPADSVSLEQSQTNLTDPRPSEGHIFASIFLLIYFSFICLFWVRWGSILDLLGEWVLTTIEHLKYFIFIVCGFCVPLIYSIVLLNASLGYTITPSRRDCK